MFFCRCVVHAHEIETEGDETTEKATSVTEQDVSIMKNRQKCPLRQSKYEILELAFCETPRRTEGTETHANCSVAANVNTATWNAGEGGTTWKRKDETVHGEIADVNFVSFDNEPYHGQTTRVDTFLQDVNIQNPTTESRPQYQYTLNGARNEMYLRGRCWIQGSNRALSFLKCLEFCGDGTVCETARDYMIRLPIGNISNASNTEQGSATIKGHVR